MKGRLITDYTTPGPIHPIPTYDYRTRANTKNPTQQTTTHGGKKRRNASSGEGTQHLSLRQSKGKDTSTTPIPTHQEKSPFNSIEEVTELRGNE